MTEEAVATKAQALVEPNVLNVLEAIGCGGLILDKAGRVLQTNERARRYLGAELSGRRTGGGEENDGIQEALRAALRASTEVLPQLGQYIVVPRAGSRPLILRSIQASHQSGAEADATTALIVLDMEDCMRPDEELLRDMFLLTAAEIRLARRLSCGENLTDIAADIGISTGTLRVQLKTLFLKTGTRRQGELIALLAHLTRLNSN